MGVALNDPVVAERTYNNELVKKILVDDGLWPTVTEDGMSVSEFYPDCKKDCYLLVKNKADGILGVYNLHPINSATLQIHAQVFPRYRKAYSKQTGYATLRWIKDNSPKDFVKVIAIIPCLYPNVHDFTLMFGFELEGVLSCSFKKNGVLHDQWILGLSRSDIPEN